MLQLSPRDVSQGIRHLRDQATRALDVGGRAEESFGAIGGQLVSGAAAFGYGVLDGAFGPIKLGPVDADLLGALLCHGAGFFGLAGRFQFVAHSLGQGLFDGYLGRTGAGVGAQLALSRAGQPSAAPSAPAQVSGGAPVAAAPGRSRQVTLAELTGIVERAR
jgi:hypothetical protein